MKNKLLSAFIVGGLSISTHAVSECTNDMSAEIMAECITIEGSGANYQDWSKNYNGRASTEAVETHSAQSAEVELGKLGIQKNK